VSYPDFEKLAHPPIKQRIKVSLRTLSIDFFDYSTWEDAPLLFRKDELIPNEHPKFRLFKSLSKQEEKLGLLPEIDSQVFHSGWTMRLRESGFKMRGHRLVKRT